MNKDETNRERERPLIRAFLLAEVLASNTFQGLRNQDISRVLGISPASVTTDLQDLEKAGWVERVPGNETRWRLTAKGMKPWKTHYEAMLKIQAQLDETDQRYSRIL